MGLRRRLFSLFEHGPAARTRLGRWLNRLLAAVILINVVPVILDTLPGLAPWMRQAFDAAEVLSSGMFTVEYLGRLWCVEGPRYAHPVKGRLRYALSLTGLVDLMAILPSYLSLFTETSALMLRLLRVLRLLKRSHDAPAVGVRGGVLREERHSLLVTFFVLLTALVFAAAGIYLVEREAQPEAFGGIPAAMWWAVATLTTVGHGDVTPVTAAGKLFASLVTLSGLAMVSLAVGIIASGFTEPMRLRRELFHDLVLEALEAADPGGRLGGPGTPCGGTGPASGRHRWTPRRIALRRRGGTRGQRGPPLNLPAGPQRRFRVASATFQPSSVAWARR